MSRPMKYGRECDNKGGELNPSTNVSYREGVTLRRVILQRFRMYHVLKVMYELSPWGDS